MKKTVLLMIFLTGCLTTTKYNGVEEMLAKHPQGSVDARDASPEAKEFIRDLLLYINHIEYELERPR